MRGGVDFDAERVRDLRSIGCTHRRGSAIAVYGTHGCRGIAYWRCWRIAQNRLPSGSIAMGSSGPLVPPSKYAPSAYRGYTTASGCVLADVILTGASHAGSTITGPTVLASLHKITSSTGAGLTPKSIDFTQPKQDSQNLQNCYWCVKIENRDFVPSTRMRVIGG